MASIVSSEEVEVSRNTAIIVASPELNASYHFCGSISIGVDNSIRLSYHSTVSTCSTRSSASFMAEISVSGISSTITKEKAPLPNSSIRMSWPATVSISPGRYVSIS